MSSLEIIGAGAGIVSAVAAVISVALKFKPQDIPFNLIRHDSVVSEPFESKTAIEVSHPDKPIKKCRVIYKGKELCEANGQRSVTILAQGTALFRIPLGQEDKDAKIIVKNGRHRLMKTTLKEVEGIKPLDVSFSKVDW